jgi:hypothetical protein
MNSNPETFSMKIEDTDILFITTINRSKYKKEEVTLTGKMAVINNINNIYLSKLAIILKYMNIDQLNIVSISNNDTLQSLILKKPLLINYLELGIKNFLELLQNNETKFLTYNKHTLYILRGGSYIHVKALLSNINNCKVNLGRGGSQKAHIISPLDLRMSIYLMALFNLDSQLANKYNTFNTISKDRYLPYINKVR